MPNQVLSSVENNFTKGLITEFTGLNFPENAATDCDNCEFTLVGDVVRRLGINNEINFSPYAIDRTNKAISTYKWNNAGGDGVTEVVVVQVGATLLFYKSSAATATSPLSTKILFSTVDLTPFIPIGASMDATLECEFTDGNGYLFVFHPSCDPVYCSYTAGTVTATAITIQIRDFIGIPENIGVSVRPATSSNEHNYNLINQGWSSGAAWTTNSSTATQGTLGSHSFTVASGLIGVSGGDIVNIFVGGTSRLVPAGTVACAGTVTSYVGTTMTINITYTFAGPWSTFTNDNWIIVQINQGHVDTWHTATGNYPSNSDVWWYFKNTSGVFDPANRVANVTVNSANAPRGHFVLNAFNQAKTSISGYTGLTDIITSKRPRTGVWFQGRVWYAGVDDQQSATGDEPFYTWTENIYFSQIISQPTQFGSCYQVNDPTSENLFDILPTDGGVIQIPGCGPVYKLFSLQNALLVFAANGVWYITGSQGIGFTATDYTIVKLSSVKSISSTSFVNVNGLPFFWNEEGIYSVEPAKQGTSLLNSPLHVNPLEVNPITIGTILTFYNNIPLSSKKYARAAYDPIEYVIKWIYRDTESTSVTNRYQFNKILNFNNSNKAFYPYTVDASTSFISSIVYVTNPGGSTAPPPTIKYLSSTGTSSVSFAEEYDEEYVDWSTANYTSFFVTGFKLHGQGQRRFQIPYLYIFSRGNTPTSYKIQGIWDYANTGDSGRWSVAQLINNWSPNFGMIYRRHKIRGQGIVLQIKVTSVDGQPFDIMGWSSFETQNTGV